MWASLEKVDEKSGKYQCDLTHLSDKAVEALEGIGLDVKEKEGKGSFITPKSKHPIYCKDSDGADLRGVPIGSGSEAVVVVKPYEWTFGGKSGVSPSIVGMVITDLCIYEDGNDVAPNLEEAL